MKQQIMQKYVKEIKKHRSGNAPQRQDFSGVTEKRLSELFPIILKEHNPEWKGFYEAEKEFLRGVFGALAVRISHIGSTAVEGLIAKPTVDILLEINRGTDLAEITEIMLDEGYVVNTPPYDIIMYLKGYTPEGFKGQAAHIHVRESKDWDELYFRDYLIAHKEAAAEYGELKKMLKERYGHDRDGYTDAKGEFIVGIVKKARVEFDDRYNPLKGRVCVSDKNF